MCPPHSQQVDEIIAERHKRAETSNPAGWRAIADAVSALSEPT
jgi:hypothetical protein